MFTLIFPNKDTMMGPYTGCPEKVLLQSWLDKVGILIAVGDETAKVISVKVTAEEIIVEMEYCYRVKY